MWFRTRRPRRQRWSAEQPAYAPAAGRLAAAMATIAAIRRRSRDGVLRSSARNCRIFQASSAPAERSFHEWLTLRMGLPTRRVEAPEKIAIHASSGADLAVIHCCDPTRNGENLLRENSACADRSSMSRGADCQALMQPAVAIHISPSTAATRARTNLQVEGAPEKLHNLWRSKRRMSLQQQSREEIAGAKFVGHRKLPTPAGSRSKTRHPMTLRAGHDFFEITLELSLACSARDVAAVILFGYRVGPTKLQ